MKWGKDTSNPNQGFMTEAPSFVQKRDGRRVAYSSQCPEEWLCVPQHKHELYANTQSSPEAGLLKDRWGEVSGRLGVCE